MFLIFVIVIIILLTIILFINRNKIQNIELFLFKKKSNVPKFPILDISNIYEDNVELYYEFIKTNHKFSKKANKSGKVVDAPIFGTKNCHVKINGKKIQQSFSSFGLPFIRV